MLKKIALLLTISFLIGQVLHAQVTTSSINGFVKSPTGDALAGATISATHEPSGTVYTTTSNSNGQFTIPNMRVGGPYLVTISFVGFQSEKQGEIYLKLGEPYVINSALKGSETSLTEVVVTAANRNSVLNANRTGSTTNISTRQIQTLPTITRSLNDFTRLTPQANGTSIGGGNYRQNQITIDGSDFNNNFGIGTNMPAGGSPISLDAVGEISVNVTPYDVRQSGFIGSAINAVTRAGTNNFAGSVYTYFRNENQQGSMAGPVQVIKQDMQFNQYGFRVGGPIIKNKLFFFINAETEKQTRPGQSKVAATATSGPGSFGSASNIARPLATELDSISRYLRNKYGYETGPYQGYDFESDKTKILARIDWNINNNHRLNVRYNQVESKDPSFASTSRSPLSSFSQTRMSNFALHFKNSNYYTEANLYSLAAELNSTFGKFGNTFRATYTNQNDPRSSDSQDFPFVDILKSDGSGQTLPFTSFGYEPFTYGNLRDVEIYSFIDNLTWSAGKHNWTVGAQADFSMTKNGFQRFATSYYTFNSWDDFVNGAKPRDFAITYPLNEKFEQAFPSFKFAQYSVYGQDEITLTQKLRVTAGLRVDLPTYPDVAEIKTHPLVASLNFANGEKINTGNLPKTSIMWSPRVGFNYDVMGDRSFQVRGGTGIFTGKVPYVWIVSQSGDAGLLQFTQTYSGAEVLGPFNPDPAYYRPGGPGNPGTLPKAGTAIPSTISAIDEDFTFPQTWKSSLAIDARLPWGIVGTLEGIYNEDLNVALGRNPNLVAPQALNVAGYPDNRPIYPNDNNKKFLNTLTSQGQPSTTATGAFNPVVLDNGSDGYYWSVTAKLEKQFNQGLSAFVAYTKSNAGVLYDGSGDQLLNTWSLTQISREANRPNLSYANYVVPDRLVASISYRKEYLKHLGTTISLFYEGSTQGRFSYTYSSDFNRDGQTNDLIYIPASPSEITFVPLTVGSGTNAVTYSAQQQSDMFFRYIEQDKYLKAHKGQYAERNGVLMPWRSQVDFKLLQDIFTNVGGKRNTLQLSLDIFNLGNFLNKNWGLTQTVNNSAILVPTNVTSLTPGGTTKPTFRLATDRGLPVTNTFRDVETISSTYYMQFGLRYIFNN